MSDSAPTLVAELLRACAEAAPQPWRPEAFFLAHPEQRDELLFTLDALWQAHVLEDALDAQGQRVGFQINPRLVGRVHDPDFAARFCAEAGLDFSPPMTPQRRATWRVLLTPPRPRVHRVLFWLNILVFGVGLFLASRNNATSAFLMPMRVVNGGVVLVQNRAVNEALVDTGLLRREDILLNHWWRLLTCGFVHIGILHLGMNMMAFRVLGPNAEWIWGPKRYLILYFLSLLGGSCAALTTAFSVGGASGALCGLLAAEATWIVLNRKHLPRRMVRRALFGFLLSGLMIGGISMASMVSGAGHLGGAAIGLAVALLFHARQFGVPIVSSLATIGLFAIPIGCIAGLQRIAKRDPVWQVHLARMERTRVEEIKEPLGGLEREARQLHGRLLKPLLEMAAARRDAAAVKEALEQLPPLIQRFRKAGDELESMPPFRTQQYEDFRLAGRDYFHARAAYMSLIQVNLEKQALWEGDEEKVAEAQKRWLERYRALK